MKGPDGNDIAPTGQKSDVRFGTVARRGEDGQIIEEDLFYDVVGFMQQVGLAE